MQSKFPPISFKQNIFSCKIPYVLLKYNMSIWYQNLQNVDKNQNKIGPGS